ncbi:phage portal protein [Shewanella sp. NKUCC01_JLK]|uniref:phage portal protein n=1 Tax=Shewanella sp. NKUCC01_JLK TaxID=2842123 RepID=UPI001C5A6F10|nr:phage portal protein [Shewanella sp. NKUCC01_JLK]MBW3517466.1 phage portal protein [Shewanella sp. NKUCC01_JLK]
MAKSLIVNARGEPFERRSQAYEGATQPPRSMGWNASSAGPNRALAAAGKTLRNRTRAGYRNSLLLKSGINKNVTNEVGRGFTLISTAKNDDFKKALNEVWKVVSTQLDPWGDMNFGGIIDLAVRSRRMSGEVFIRRLRRRLSAGLEVPVQVEVLEADLCPIDLNRKLDNGNRIVQGVEFRGKVKVAYWFYLSHPEDGIDFASLNQLERVPVKDVIHHYKQTRPGQVRAEPEAAVALLKDRTFADYDDAELVRKKERAAFTGFLYRESFEEDDWEFDPTTGKPLYDDGEGAPEQTTVAAGTLLRGVPGEKLEQFDGDNTGQGYKDFVRWQALQLAAGLEIPYSLLTGDWSGLNDRLVRAFLNEYRRGIAFDQTNLSGFQVAFKIWRWVIEAAVSVGRLYAPGFANDPYQYLMLDIRPDAFKHLHPEQEINARKKAVDSNISNIEVEAADHGRDIEDNMRRNAKARKRWQEICKEEGVENPGTMTGIFSEPETSEEPGE